MSIISSFGTRLLNTLLFWNQGILNFLAKSLCLILKYLFSLFAYKKETLDELARHDSIRSLRRNLDRKYVSIAEIESETKFSRSEIKLIYRGFKQVYFNGFNWQMNELKSLINFIFI